MFRRLLFRTPRNQLSIFRKPLVRRYANEAPQKPSSQSRIERFNRRLPKFLHKYTNALGTAPLTHITAFLLLHELTAIIPLFGLAATFHYTQWLPTWFAEGAWVLKGVELFGRYFRRKGWIRSDEAADAEREANLEMRKIDRVWNLGEGGARVVVEFATAYAIVKMLIPLRIVLSVWGAPWFAKRTVIPASNLIKRLFRRGKSKTSSPAAGTGSVDGGVVPRAGSGKPKG